MRYLISTAFLATAIPSLAWAEPMTFDAALERAAGGSPSVQATKVGVDATRFASIAAGQLPDPTLSFGIDNFPVSGPPAFSFTREFMTMERIGLEQSFPNPAKRRAQRGRAQADVGVAEADLAVEVQKVRLETALAWIDLYYAKRRLAQFDLLNNSLHDLQETVSARLAAGTARPSQVLEPEQLRATIADRSSELIAEIAAARARLVRFTLDPEVDVEGDPPKVEIDRNQIMAGLGSLPMLRSLDAGIDVADTNTQLARAEKRPDWRLSTSYGRRDPAFGDMVSIGVSFDLPLFAKRRQDPKIAARANEAEQARLMRAAGELEIVAALDADLAEHAMHQQLLMNSHNTLVPLARRRAELDMASYAAGRLDLGSALLATLALAEAEIDALAREADVARGAIRINFTYGEMRP